ncbi:hypothetical protein LWC34_03910 [Kibdelosporangium philippinense]|uniref:Uncharacterized protein n=1 Tax=Kibdelosporangium philippinense TaxID=211113 RepID=A0ABS8Z2H6_9PSEU|nr:hypothetical protein [Kibdelosporangium philippinense]MCE7001980.1 hypothetical protein [Kibdelosporangium philippinense]
MQAVLEYARAHADRGPKFFQGVNNLKNGPIHLSTEPSMSRLRREILTLQDLAEHPLPKRKALDAEPIREHTELYVSVPGYAPSNLDLLATELRELPTRQNDLDADSGVISINKIESSEISVDDEDVSDFFSGRP